MRRLARQALAVLAWVLVGGIVLQVFFAGMGLFGASNMALHVDVGYTLPIVPLVMLILCWPARAGRQTALLSAGLLVLSAVQGFLPLLRDDAPLVAALHPPNALLLFALSLVAARRATLLMRAGRPPAEGAA